MTISGNVRKFDCNMIKNYLEKTGWPYYQDKEGDFLVTFSRDEDTNCEIKLYLELLGDNKEIYRIEVVSDRLIPRKDWGRAVMLCNTWNRKNLVSTAFLYIENPDTDETGIIILKQALDLEKGIHQELFDDFTHTVFIVANQFWVEVNKENKL